MPRPWVEAMSVELSNQKRPMTGVLAGPSFDVLHVAPPSSEWDWNMPPRPSTQTARARLAVRTSCGKSAVLGAMVIAAAMVRGTLHVRVAALNVAKRSVLMSVGGGALGS